MTFLHHFAQIFQRDIGAATRVVETTVCVLFYDGRFVTFLLRGRHIVRPFYIYCDAETPIIMPDYAALQKQNLFYAAKTEGFTDSGFLCYRLVLCCALDPSPCLFILAWPAPCSRAREMLRTGWKIT